MSDNVKITFVNNVTARGILNNVVNISFNVLNFTPTEDGTEVHPDSVVACRLRMDRVCAYQLRDVMNQLIEVFEKAENGNAIEAPKNEGLIAKETVN